MFNFLKRTNEEKLVEAKAEKEIILEAINKMKSFPSSYLDRLINVEKLIAVLEWKISKENK